MNFGMIWYPHFELHTLSLAVRWLHQHEARLQKCDEYNQHTYAVVQCLKQQHETYLQLNFGLAEANAPAKQPISFHRNRLPCSLSPCRGGVCFLCFGGTVVGPNSPKVRLQANTFN